MDASAFIAFLIAAVCLTLAPGPDILFVLSKSLSSGTRAGIRVACGLVTGTFIHTVLAAFGISLLIRESELAFSLLRWVGVAYLSYLGLCALRQINASSEETEAPDKPERSLYLTGIFMAALNPKLIIFFLALFPQFIPADTAHPTLQTLLLGLCFSVQALIIFTAVALFAGKVSQTLRRKPGIAKSMNLLSVLVLFGIAVGVACVRR